jgi:chromosome partitioning protein
LANIYINYQQLRKIKMIIAVLNTKGGTGKTVTALNLAVSRALLGRNVLAVDGDSQGSLMSALSNRSEPKPLLAVAQYTEGMTLRKQVQRATELYEDIVIDAGGRDNSALRSALLVADAVIIPFQPRSFDVWALDDMKALLDEARAVKDVRAYALLTLADARGTDNVTAGESVPAGLTLLPVAIGRRKVIAEAAGLGMSVLELAPSRDPKAFNEISVMAKYVFETALA